MTPKSINALMKIMRDSKGIQISGKTQKKKLRYMGYYHGYKGYRFRGSQLLTYSDFNQLQAVYDFDKNLKSILYPNIMFLETTIKNYALEVIINETQSDQFTDTYNIVMNDYKAYPVNDQRFKTALEKRLNVRNKIYSVISRGYGRNGIVNHYYNSDRPLPIWGIFELLSLGEFGNFISCLNMKVRKDISRSIGIKTSVDSDGKMVEKFIFVLKDLRNAVAHNNIVFDIRFCTRNIDGRIAKYITAETQVNNITFDSIVDYILLIAFVMVLLERSKTEILSYIKQFEDICQKLNKSVPFNIYSKIVYTDTNAKLNAFKSYIKAL